jgi:hypothetical protein
MHCSWRINDTVALKKNFDRKAVLWVRIRMDPHDFGLLDPHPESALQMRIPDADADPV